jgi:DNA polymerase III sliding clamp (beta) subunit (PCNA family)
MDRTILKKALETVKPGLATKEKIDQSTTFCFVDGYVVTYNDEISVRYPIDAEFSGAVNAEELYGFINKINTDEIEIEEDGNQLLLKAGRAKAGLTIQSEIKLPMLEVDEIDNWRKLPKGFFKALDFARASCATDMTNEKLTCVHINKKIIEGCDNLRVARMELDSPVKVGKFLLPAGIAGTIIRLKPTEIAEEDGPWMHFKTKDNAIISCRLFSEDEYVDIDKFLGDEGDEIEFPEQILELLDKAEVFAKRDQQLNEAVTITIQPKKLVVRSESDTGGWFEEKAKISYKGEPLTFSVTLYLIKDILRETLKAQIKDSKLWFEGDNWIYFTMLRS